MDIRFHILEEITNGFSADSRIGRGGYGDVYKGVYNGEVIAMKLLHVDTVQELDDQQFKNEVANLLRIEHPNIVRLLGYCYETLFKFVKYNGEDVFGKHIYRVLCFEYLQGGSLDMHLHAPSLAPNWSTRYSIIKGVCEGLNFLHGCKPPILHLDLKPANILLDSSMESKVADFGLLRLFSRSHTHVTKRIVGTQKYMPPEFVKHGIVSSKNDVFSLGVVIIEIITGPTGYSDFWEMGGGAQFMQEVLTKWSTVIEATSNYRSEELSQVQICIGLAIQCVDSERNNRPTIAEILDALNMTETHSPKREKCRREMQETCIELAIHCVDSERDNRPTTAGIMDALNRTEANIANIQVKGGSEISMGMANTIMDASEDSVLEHIMFDRSVEPTNVPLALLKRITEDFAERRQIGRGGFGVVYKGHLKNGSVAVKRLSNPHTIDEELFYREATCLISVKHENIVRLLGYCANTEHKAVPHPNPKEKMKFVFAEIIERLFCFEYVKNGSLDKYLNDELRGLEWHTRYKIIKGICNGLDYLHNEKGMIHRDMKPANILVDDLMVPKITDFGVSKLLDGATHAVTSNNAMSFGYSAPEFIHHGEVSFKSDIFSFVVIIRELVTGHKGDPDIKNVLRKWRHRWNKTEYPPLGYQQVTKCIEIASRCLSDSPKKRPSVRDILSMLDAIERTDVQINGDGESPVGPISPYPWELLEFDKLELNFPFEINKQIPCSLELTNVTDDYVTYDFQNTGMLEYCIEPNKGVVQARSKCIVMVTLQARKVAPYDMMCKDEFVVRCAALNEGLAAVDIHEGKFVDEVMLAVVVEHVAIT